VPSDEFKDVGRHFADGEHVSLPAPESGGDHFTIEGWFIWLSGDGPLFATVNGQWEFIYDRNGRCAYRVGEERVTSVAVDSVRDRWIYLVVAKADSNVMLRIDDAIVDQWNDAPSHAALSEAVVMKDAVGFAADIAYYDRRLPDESIDSHWHAGKDRV
jgi:hypothetical protein